MKRQERWDRVLTQYEFNHLRPEEKGLRALTSLSRKIAFLEDLAIGRFPYDPSNIPMTSRPKLREYEDPSRGLWKWSVAKVDSLEGDNRELMLRYQAALMGLKEMPREKASREATELPQDVLHLRNIISSLRRQNRDFLERIDRLERLLASAQSRS